MSNEFDMDRVRAGEEVQYKPSVKSNWYDVNCVGMLTNGDVVIEIDYGVILRVSASDLRMKPKTSHRWIQCYTGISSGYIGCTDPHWTPEEAMETFAEINSSGQFKINGVPQKVILEVE